MPVRCEVGENLSLYQLLHCNVYNQKDEHLGKVTDILETGAHLNLRVHKDDKSFLLPFVDAFVKEVDPEEKIIRIEDMEGLH